MSINSSEKAFHFTLEEDLVLLSDSSEDENSCASDKHQCGEKCININITEVIDPRYGLYVWPCAPVLAQYIWYNKGYIKGKTTLELGAGTALPSVVAAKCGAHVLVTDGETFSQTLDCSKRNLLLNAIDESSFEVTGLSWGNFNPSLLNLKSIDIILGSDVFYEPEEFEDVIVTVSYIMQRNNIHAEFWCAYEERSSDDSIGHILKEWQLNCKEVMLDEVGISDSTFRSWNITPKENIHLYVMKHDAEVGIS